MFAQGSRIGLAEGRFQASAPQRCAFPNTFDRQPSFCSPVAVSEELSEPHIHSLLSFCCLLFLSFYSPRPSHLRPARAPSTGDWRFACTAA